MNTQRACEIQAVLEGVPLPATRSRLLEYARAQDPAIAADLEVLPEMKFDRLDAVADLLTMRPPAPRQPDRRLPRAESGEPPGGPDYLTPFPSDTGLVRRDAPPGNPPQKAVQAASQLQKKQKAEQGA